MVWSSTLPRLLVEGTDARRQSESKPLPNITTILSVASSYATTASYDKIEPLLLGPTLHLRLDSQETEMPRFREGIVFIRPLSAFRSLIHFATLVILPLLGVAALVAQ